LSKKEYLNGLLPDDGNTRDNDVHTKQFISSFLPGLICKSVVGRSDHGKEYACTKHIPILLKC